MVVLAVSHPGVPTTLGVRRGSKHGVTFLRPYTITFFCWKKLENEKLMLYILLDCLNYILINYSSRNRISGWVCFIYFLITFLGNIYNIWKEILTD